MRGSDESLAIFLCSAAFTLVFLINFCNLVYQCGCRSLWAGAADHCNIHTPGVKHCPWCSIGDAGFAGVTAAILLPQGILSFRPRRWHWTRRLAASLLAFPAAGLVVALAIGLATGYWS